MIGSKFIKEQVKVLKKICVIGAGRWGANHIRTLSSIGCLAGVVEKNPLLIESVKEQHSDIYVFDDLNKALKNKFDAFVVATPAETHYPIAKKILNYGAHVLVEKPFTTKLEDAIELNELSKQKKLKLMVGHVLLFHPAFNKIKELIDSGEVGDLQYLYSNRLNLGTIRTEENVFWSFAPHDIALFQFFIGSNPEKVNSHGIDILQKNIHDSTITTLEYPNKVMGHIFVSWLHPFKEHRFVVVGSKGMIHFEDSIDSKPLIFYKKSVDWENGVPIPKDAEGVNIKYDNKMPLELELKYFVNNLDNNSQLISNGDTAVEVMRILTSATEKLFKS